MNGLDALTIGKMSFWQYVMTVEGWNAAHDKDGPPVEPPSAAEFHEMVERLG